MFIVRLRIRLESARSQRHEFWNGRKIPIGILKLAVPEIRGQLPDAPMDILAIKVPLQQSPDREGMPQSVYSRIPAPAQSACDLAEGHEDLQILE